MDASGYLARLGAPAPEKPGLDALGALQRAHLLRVPFENLDIHRGVEIRLELPRLYEKIVRRGRGGFCYELNGLFAWLLASLGYAVDHVSARVYDAASGTFSAEFDHLALLVHLDRTYLVDVGFGDSARTPIPLPDGVAEDLSGRYRVVEQTPETFCLDRRESDGWRAQHAFSTTPHPLDAFAAMCAHHQTSPDSHFTRNRVITLATPRGRVTLTPKSLKLTQDGALHETPLKSPDEFDALLKQHFGLQFQ